MSAYSSGSCNVTIGSQTVTGNSTRWDLYLSAGYVFKLTTSSVCYEIADVVSSRELTLTARYADSAYETKQASEHVATITHATLNYTGNLDNTPVIRSSLTIVASSVTWEDDGAGVLATTSGAGVGSAGTISYDDGAYSFSLTATADIATSLTITATYNSGDALSAMSYQVVDDYTTHYNFPEVDTTDANTEHIITKAFRLIDSRIYNASINNASIATSHIGALTASSVIATTVKTSRYIQMGSHQYIFFGSANGETAVVNAATAIDASIRGSMYLSNYATPAIWFYDSDSSATQMQTF